MKNTHCSVVRIPSTARFGLFVISLFPLICIVPVKKWNGFKILHNLFFTTCSARGIQDVCMTSCIILDFFLGGEGEVIDE